MSLRPADPEPIPAETARVARAAFPKGTAVMHLRDELGPIYEDRAFADLFARRGKPAEAPWRLALVTVLQFAENLSDRQAADAVRSRIDWKYALGLALTDDGFDYSVLSKFRARLLDGEAEQQLLDVLVTRCQERGLVKAGGRARTDSTHVLAAIRTLNRLECVGETLRAALNDLAVVAPDWLRARVDADWFDRYGARFAAYRLPKGEAERQALAETIGRDGFTLLTAVFAADAPAWLRAVPIVDILRRTWVYQYWIDDGVVRWRKAGELAPAGVRLDSPYDPEAHFGNKRTATWTGYKVHLTETGDPEQIHLITHVDTTLAAVSDVARTADVHDALAEKGLLPREHLVDAGYVDGPLLVTSRAEHGIDLVGPVRPNVSWQAKVEGAYDIAAFTVEWAAQRVICPQGRVSTAWVPHEDAWGNQVISAKFARDDCLRCGHRACCTRSATAPRHLTFRPEAEHEALQRVRQEQTTPAWQARYHRRAGIEGTLAQGIRAFCRPRRVARQSARGFGNSVSGGTYTGKTTLLNGLGMAITDRSERVITIEDTAELQLADLLPDCEALQARVGNIEKRGGVKQRDLVKNALRMQPTRIILGEVRDEAALDMLRAMNTGHSGSMGTAHSNGARDALDQIALMAMYAREEMPLAAIKQMIARTIQLVLYLDFDRDRRRRLVHIYEVVDIDANGTIIGQDLWQYNPETGRLGFTDLVPRCLETIRRKGIQYTLP